MPPTGCRSGGADVCIGGMTPLPRIRYHRRSFDRERITNLTCHVPMKTNSRGNERVQKAVISYWCLRVNRSLFARIYHFHSLQMIQ